MLTKLLKYEFRDTARTIPFLYLITLFFAAIAFIAGRLKISFITATSSVFLIIAGVSVFIVTFALVAIRFYRNLYSNEGYLMFTLPVKPHELLISKVIAGFCWITASLAVFAGALFEAMHRLGFGLNELAEIRNELAKAGLENAIYLIIPAVLFSILFFISQIYFAITVANMPCFRGIGVAASFIAFIVTYVALKIVETAAAIFIPLSVNINLIGRKASITTDSMFGYLLASIQGNEPVNITVGIGGYLIDIIIVCVLLYVTGRLMNRKVSLR
ncbi:hypothetical protein LY28_02141 [Ruminiclostridium sufflavum DSM 19573]|uniref:ABC-2 family transporter n=1 Tax=Ruminiclostridium sufflavum DSM 19573 TaxID=1121337 RepID=A0A318XND9_9FIRM|nr:ABC transporter permease [Ruminiclostridium sufflavum]PYG87471.1 hypothetical protein LY28_02141 [Ruminiclostridium sufflavum DSM 19573]